MIVYSTLNINIKGIKNPPIRWFYSFAVSSIPKVQSEPVHYPPSQNTPYQQYNKWRPIHYSDTPIAFHTTTADIPT